MRSRSLLLILWALITVPATAQAFPSIQLVVTASVPPGTDSEKAHLLSLLVKGDIDGAISYWGAVNAGKQLPIWLLALKTSYAASKQAAGHCQAVARNIHAAFKQLGGKPQFIELTAKKDGESVNIIFRTDTGRDVMMSNNGYHVLVGMEGVAYDAYTGPRGLPWKTYLDRLGSLLPIQTKVSAAVPEPTP